MVVPLFLGTADECFLAADDSLVQSAGTGPTVTALYDGQQLVVLSPATHLTTLQQQHPAANCAYSNAAVSLDGLHLLALCGPHQPYIELWALSPLQPLLTQDVLPYGTGQCLSFHPSNSLIACSIAHQQAEVLCFDKVLGQLITRKATVTAAAWRDKEQILCHSWTPNGMLVLGTSAGRILKAEGAVPAKGRPATTWGHDSPLTAEPLPGWECTSSILHIHLTQQHLVVMHASADSSAAASAIWLDNHSLQQIARLALPTNTCHAWTDLSLSKAVVSTTCGSVFTFSIHPQGQPASLTLVSKQHVKEVVGLAFLSATSMISVSQDGVAGLWQLQKGTSGVLTAQLSLQDKSLHKYKLVVPTTMPAAHAKVLPLLSPDRGFPMQKGCRALLLDKLGRLLAAASDGCCYLLDAESLHQDARLILHPSQTGGISAIACSQDGLIACGSTSGVISLSTIGRTSPSAMRLLPPHQSLATSASSGSQKAHVVFERQDSGGEKPAMVPQVAQEEQAALRQQLHSLKTCLETAVQLNSSLEPELQLSPQALILNSDLRDHLLSEGKANVRALRHALQHEQLTDEVKAARIKAACWDTMATPQAVIVPVSQACLTTGLGNAGDISRKQSMFSSTEDLSRGITGIAAGSSSLHEDCDRGRSRLLYGSMELHTPGRQISQAVLLQHEAHLIRQAFNQQFEVTQAAKRDLIVSLDERLARITNIERELGLHPQVAATSEVLEDPAPDGVLTVDDLEEHDKKVQDWMQQQQRHRAALETELKTLRVHKDLDAKQSLVSDVSSALIKAQGHLDEVSPQGRAVDKAFKRELGPLPYYSDLLQLYQDRTRGYTYQPDFRMAELDQMLTTTSSPSPQEQQLQAPVLGVPFVQRILHERRAASQAAQSGTEASPSKHVSLSHQPSTVHSPSSPSRGSLVPPWGCTTPARLSRSPSMCPTPKSPGHRLSTLPTSTSRRSLKPKGIEAEDALLELKELGPLGIPPSSAACNPFATELVLKAFTDMPAVPPDPSALSGALLGSEDMPRLCKPEHWARLLALRDARLSLDSDAAQLGNTVQLLSDQLVVLQDEQACLVSQLEAAEQVEGELSNELRHYQSDLQVRLSLQTGQVEAADRQPLSDQSDMLLMDRQEVVLLNSLILTEGQAKLAQQKAVWTAERQSLVAHWEQQHLSLQIQAEEAHLQDVHLLHLSHDSPYRNSGGGKVVVKKESTAAFIQKQQARQQAGLAIVYERELALERAVAKRGQENAEQSTVKNLLADEAAALSRIYEPIKDRAGDARKRLDASMRQSHAVHVLREISHQQQADIERMMHEIARLSERSKASFALQRPAQPDIIYSV
ncbi:hypothetical protein WJX79_010339 [Trebouxia sp. C0005]